jgi:hypothetical protein
MKKFFLPLLIGSFLLTSCDQTTPQNYFDRAVLSSNQMRGFAGTGGIERELRQPSIKLVDPARDETAQMTRKEVVELKLAFIEQAYERVKALPESEDTREMVYASLALYEYVLPVYKNEYLQLARLYDEKAPEREIETFQRHIQDQYRPGFQSRMDTLLDAAKPYADRHGIKVNWSSATTQSP